ncbi:protein shifted-like isoform X1 [Cataglyphis hispanica]|uniref:protein shifted-like isoform X1 n=1 Tax=Cataglyphis hispanica TaxID=1086592 RepID=UPI00218043CA|nr:protein shifted-like isoform X1 [Cataglyphis hispanica]
MRSAAAVLAAATALVLFLDGALARHKHRSGNGAQKSDISLWIDQQQTKIFSGLAMEIYAIAEGRVLSPLLDPEFESKLPIIPSEVSHVNFTWKAGTKKYFYNFFRLKSFDESILKTPSITIETHGRVPKRPKVFSILLPCAGKGIAQFGIGLMIESRNGIPLNGTPLRFRLRKECSVRGECVNRAHDHHLFARTYKPNPGPCPDGYLGPPHCNKALCYPKCMNGGNCTAPGVCSCPPGYQGPYCEGGICREKCLNGGKCVQKDVCECTKGYFGLHCEFSKCVIPCLNGGKCKGNNICRCPKGFKGNHCEIGRRSPQRSTCTRTCRNGTCQSDNTCRCDSGWFGKLCNKNKPWA